MNKVKVENAAMNVYSGQVQLTGAQAAVRMHALKLIGKAGKDGSGVYEVVSQINFKIGETFGFSGEVAKNGQLRDPEAEALAKLEAEDRVRAEMDSKYGKALSEMESRLRAEHAAALTKALAEQEAKLRAELAPKPQ